MNDAPPLMLFYDGHCGFCHAVVVFFLRRDTTGKILFAPLQGDTFRKKVSEETRRQLPDSIVLLMLDGSFHLKSSAVVGLLHALGGGWYAAAALLWLIPKPLRDLGYDAVGLIRRKLLPPPSSLCPIVLPALKARFLP